MVEHVAEEYVRDGLDRAFAVVSVVVVYARDSFPGRGDVDLTVRVGKAQSASGNDGNKVVVVVDAREVRDLKLQGRARIFSVQRWTQEILDGPWSQREQPIPRSQRGAFHRSQP